MKFTKEEKHIIYQIVSGTDETGDNELDEKCCEGYEYD